MNDSTPRKTDKKSRAEKRSLQPTAYGLGVIVPLVVIFFAIGVGTGYLIWGRSASSAQAANTAASATPAAADSTADSAVDTSQIVRYAVSADDDPAYGPQDAPITIIEFSDFQCPYCVKWATEIWPQIQAAYPDQIRLVYRDFPLYSIHANAEPAAVAANCANEQGQFWPFHDLLVNSDLGLSRQSYETFASTLGLDMTSFTACLDANSTDEITADYDYAVKLGIQSTPTFFVNGIALIGAQPYEVFKQVIDLELAGQIPQ